MIQISKSTLEDLYVKKKKTTHEIAEILNTTQNNIAELIIFFNIDISPKQRKFEHLKATPLTQHQKELILGSLLGNAEIKKQDLNYSLIINHKEKDLIFWKKDILANLVNVVNKRTNNNSTFYNFSTVIHHELKQFHDLLYSNNKKVIKEELITHLTPLSLAVWIMDDSIMNNVNLKLQTAKFTEDDCKLLQYMIKVKFEIRCKIAKYNRRNTEYCYLSFNKENTIKLAKLTEPYFADCMKYKLHHDDQ